MTKNKKLNNPKKKRETWTIQPADDVRRIVAKVLGPAPERGALTNLLNQAVRLKSSEAALALLDSEIEALKAKKEVLKRRA